MSIHRDIVIIGGGAAGLACAVRAAENNKNARICILEKQPRVGKKLLATGNGRCNLTNTCCSKANYHGSFVKYCDEILDKYPPEKVISFFEGLGLLTKTDREGRVYPYSNHSSSVLDALRYRAEALNVETLCDCKVTDVKGDKYFRIKTENEVFSSEKLVVAAGSCASPKLGGCGGGLDILEKTGHKIIPFSPALCSVKVSNGNLKSLKGIRAYGRVSLLDKDRPVKEEYGEIQFADNALSGICVFNISSMLCKTKEPVIKLSLLPGYEEKQIYELLLRQRDIMQDRQVEDYFTGIFHKRLSLAILKECKLLSPQKRVNDLSDEEIRLTAEFINNWIFKNPLPRGFENAQTASGGVTGDQINPHTMESLLIKNLYICGECVDINGDCGGYNLQFAFASGLAVGDNL